MERMYYVFNDLNSGEIFLAITDEGLEKAQALAQTFCMEPHYCGEVYTAEEVDANEELMECGFVVQREPEAPASAPK